MTIKVFDDLKVSFLLNFSPVYYERRVNFDQDLDKVTQAVSFLKERLKALQYDASKVPLKSLDKEQKRQLKEILEDAESSKGNKGYELQLMRFRDLLEDLWREKLPLVQQDDKRTKPVSNTPFAMLN